VAFAHRLCAQARIAVRPNRQSLLQGNHTHRNTSLCCGPYTRVRAPGARAISKML
jgi:hypothetical protein